MYNFNQLANITNPYQGKSKRVLCLCSAGLLRSPTAAYILCNKYGYNTRSAGLTDVALIPVSLALVLWADEIIVMEKLHIRILEATLDHWNHEKIIDSNTVKVIMDKVISLDIPDQYSYMDTDLMSLITTNYERIENDRNGISETIN